MATLDPLQIGPSSSSSRLSARSNSVRNDVTTLRFEESLARASQPSKPELPTAPDRRETPPSRSDRTAEPETRANDTTSRSDRPSASSNSKADDATARPSTTSNRQSPRPDHDAERAPTDPSAPAENNPASLSSPPSSTSSEAAALAAADALSKDKAAKSEESDEIGSDIAESPAPAAISSESVAATASALSATITVAAGANTTANAQIPEQATSTEITATAIAGAGSPVTSKAQADAALDVGASAQANIAIVASKTKSTLSANLDATGKATLEELVPLSKSTADVVAPVTPALQFSSSQSAAPQGQASLIENAATTGINSAGNTSAQPQLLTPTPVITEQTPSWATRVPSSADPLSLQPAQASTDDGASTQSAPVGTLAPTANGQSGALATPAAQATSADVSQLVRENVPLNRLGIEIATTARAGIKEIEVRLNPPELGSIDVRLDIDDSGQVNTHLVVERASTLDQLRRDAPNLERLLNQSGLKADSGSLQFSLRDQNQPYRQQSSERGRTRRGVLAIDGVEGTTAANSTTLAYSARLRSGVDVRL